MIVIWIFSWVVRVLNKRSLIVFLALKRVPLDCVVLLLLLLIVVVAATAAGFDELDDGDDGADDNDGGVRPKLLLRWLGWLPT